MQLRPDWGTYIPGLVTLEGSFRTNTSSAPDSVRTGNTGLFTVARTSAGLFTVTFVSQTNGGIQLPEKLIVEGAWCNVGVADTVGVQCNYVAGSYSAVTRSFQIQCKSPTAAGNTALVAADPAALNRISFFLRGSLVGIGTDA